VEITEVEHPSRAGDASYLWGQLQETGSQWGDPEIVVTWTVMNEVEIRTDAFDGLEPSDTTPTYVSPPPAETDEATTLFSSDGRMSLTPRDSLGAGSYGTVVSADWVEGQRRVAVKVSHKLFISELDCTEPGLRNLKNELDVLKALKQSREYGELGSNFFPELFKSWQDAKNVYFVMELYPWNLEDLRWANPDWDASTGDKLLWAAEMVRFRFTFVPLSRSCVPADSWCSGPPPNADLTPRHKAGQRLRHVHQTPHHRRLRSRARLAGPILRQLPIFLPESPRRPGNNGISRPGGGQWIL
jgi:hypothetical protein